VLKGDKRVLAEVQEESTSRQYRLRLTAAEREGCVSPMSLCLHLITLRLTDMVLKDTKQKDRVKNKQHCSHSLRARHRHSPYSLLYIVDLYSYHRRLVTPSLERTGSFY
jgi:hypothetical protein